MPIRETDAEIAAIAREHLEAVIRVDTQSDEDSTTIPSTEGQRLLAAELSTFFEAQGAQVELDDNANVVATLPGRGAGASAAPLALMVHIDTARGSEAVPHMELLPSWDGSRIPYPANDRLQVSVETYPATQPYLGQDLLHGPGRAPMGLDDKLGLAHVMTLAQLLRTNPEIAHPPLVLVGRPDEEIGRMEAVEGLALTLASRGVVSGYTIDGIWPFEINVENFNASGASMTFPSRSLDTEHAIGIAIHLGGVNTHPCAAKEEGARAATRLAAEMVHDLETRGWLPDRVVPIAFASDDVTDCNGILELAVTDEATRAAVVELAEAVMTPHIPRGASLAFSSVEPTSPEGATLDLLRFVQRFYADPPGFVLLAEESDGYQGYSSLYRAVPVNGGLRLDARLRDFALSGLEAREVHLRRAAAGARAVDVEVKREYVNMGPQLRKHPELVSWAAAAGKRVGIRCPSRPIRGGTGVDPFLDQGIPVANLGTGYFALESEKEFTSLQMLAGHAHWLVELVQVVAEEGPRQT